MHIGADLSQSRDLTAIVLSVQNPDTGVIHIKPYVSTPQEGLEIQAQRDRASIASCGTSRKADRPAWKECELQHGRRVHGEETDRMNLASMNFDRWRIELSARLARRKALPSTRRYSGTLWESRLRTYHPDREVSEELRMSTRRSRTEGTRYLTMAPPVRSS